MGSVIMYSMKQIGHATQLTPRGQSQQGLPLSTEDGKHVRTGHGFAGYKLINKGIRTHRKLCSVPLGRASYDSESIK